MNWLVHDMTASFYRAVTTEIKKLGFQKWKPAKGSHEKWRNSDSGIILLVPFNMKSRHTANSILKDAGSSFKL